MRIEDSPFIRHCVPRLDPPWEILLRSSECADRAHASRTSFVEDESPCESRKIGASCDLVEIEDIQDCHEPCADGASSEIFCDLDRRNHKRIAIVIAVREALDRLDALRQEIAQTEARRPVLYSLANLPSLANRSEAAACESGVARPVAIIRPTIAPMGNVVDVLI